MRPLHPHKSNKKEKEVKKKSKNQTNYIATNREIEWLARAISHDPRSSRLWNGALAYYDGCAVLVTTDTFRMHMVKLGKCDRPFDAKIVDLKSVLSALREHKLDHAAFQLDQDVVQLYKQTISGEMSQARFVERCAQRDVGNPWVSFERAIPTTNRPVSEFFGMKSKYLTDALMIACGESVAIHSEDGSSRAIVFRPEGDRWMAVVMPSPMLLVCKMNGRDA